MILDFSELKNFSFLFFLLSIALAVTSTFVAKKLLQELFPQFKYNALEASCLRGISVVCFYSLFTLSQASCAQEFFLVKGPWCLFLFALSVTMHTDAQALLISRWCTLFIAPFGFLFAYLGLLNVTFTESMAGALLGFITLWITAKLAHYLTRQEALGQGDIDLLFFVGAFLGPEGCWSTLLWGSILGSLFGIALLLLKGEKARSTKLPFGTFLALAASIILIRQLNHLPLIPFF